MNTHAVVFCSDEKGLPFALFAASQIACLAPQRDFDILICGFEKLVIPARFENLGIQAQNFDFTEQIADLKIEDMGHLTNQAFLKLWLPQEFVTRYQRLLYLDIDTYHIGGDLSALLRVDLKGKALAGVRDVNQWGRLKAPVHDFEERGLPGHKYLNSGMMLIDTEAWEDQNILHSVVQARNPGEVYHYHDQSLLNLALRGNWAELSPVWNWQLTRNDHLMFRLFSPNILHFAGVEKPWHPDARQLHHDRRIVSEYKRFLALHFPDRFSPVPARSDYSLSTGGRVKMLFKGLLSLPALHRLTRRFKHDLDVLI